MHIMFMASQNYPSPSSLGRSHSKRRRDMDVLEFSVDRELRIVECGRDLETARLGSTAGLLGTLYFEVLPRIFWEGSDAVAAVVDSGRPLSLSRYSFSCLFECFEADVEIFPLKSDSARPEGARVIIRTTEGCTSRNLLRRSQSLIDIGKNAAILSHGVRNPLNAIKGAVVYLKNRFSHEATLLEFTQIMEEEISRLDRFITAFLSGSAGEPEKRTTDLNDLLKRIESLTSLQAQAAGVKVLFRYGEVAPLQLSPFQVEQAILNVLNNALHVLSPGGMITVESKVETRDGRPFCVVEVTDDGPGIRSRPGEGFSAPLEDTARAHGKGFGLFITREVLQSHGGMLEVRSGEDMGTTVRLCFPRESREGAR